MEINSTSDNKPDHHSEKIVVGANPLSHFNVRCPGCAKLFRVDSKEIKSSSPYFDCTACKTRFTFDFPPLSLNNIETRTVSQKDSFQLADSVDQEASTDLKKCPKCSAMNPRLTKDCLKCGVLFEKVEDLPMDSGLGAIPSLVKAWQDLMSDYSNLRKHVTFVDRCEDLQALPYALKKYQTLKEVQPQDPLTQQMFHQVLIRNLRRKSGQIGWLQSVSVFFAKYSAKVNWPRVRKLSPFALSFAMMIVGLSHPAARNIVGLGAALLFLTIGLRVFLKGRISLEDFW